MRKLVLGIIAVVCVQFAFVIFMNLQSPLDLAAAPVGPSPEADETDLSWMDELDRSGDRPKEETDSALNATEPVDRVEPASTRRDIYTPSARPSRKHGSAGPKKYIYFPEPAEATPGDFETVVISYNRPAVIPASYDPAPVISDCERPVAPRAKKRSYFAKAAPVVKKPWEVMKSIASRLY